MSCEHRKKKSFAVSKDSIQHEYCPDCGWHLFDGKEYTKAEWYKKYISEWEDSSNEE